MTTSEIFEYLLELNQLAAKELIKTYHDEIGKETFLIFPRKRDREIRVSEQELRVAMTSLFGSYNYKKLAFSVETPTDKVYSFKGNKSRSGSTDLTFYEAEKKILNVELKAHNTTQQTIDKDIEKLVSEDCNGAWCHIFLNEDSGTIQSIFDKLQIALNKVSAPIKPLFFSFIILKQRKLITRKGKDDDLQLFHPGKIFDLKYSDHGKFTSLNNKKGDWQINYY